MNNVATAEKSKIEGVSLRKNKMIIKWANNVELFSTTKVRTNYVEAWELVPQKDGMNKSQYYGKWITDLEITTENAKTIIDAARARWKIENECFNSLKNHGYNIEHNYGHGSNNLCYNFYNFTLLAFTMHQYFGQFYGKITPYLLNLLKVQSIFCCFSPKPKWQKSNFM